MRTLVLSFVALAVFSGATSSGAPDAATLGVPVYPGARFDDSLSKMYLKLGVRAGMPAPKAFAAFATSHGIERVAEFYRTNLRPPDPALASTWFAVDEEDLQFLVGSQLDALEGPARRKAEAVVNAG